MVVKTLVDLPLLVVTKSMTTRPSVILGIIGDEVLSGSVPESNANHGCRKLFLHGYQVIECRWLPDNPERIESFMKEVTKKADIVITSGGVGPTHDDYTLAALASVFERPLEQSSSYLNLIQASHPELKAEHLPLIPQGCALVYPYESPFPCYQIENCYCLAGIPQFFRDQLEAVLALLPEGPPQYTATHLYPGPETDIFHLIQELQQQLPDVEIGIYPMYQGQEDTAVVITSDNEERLSQASNLIQKALSL